MVATINGIMLDAGIGSYHGSVNGMCMENISFDCILRHASFAPSLSARLRLRRRSSCGCNASSFHTYCDARRITPITPLLCLPLARLSTRDDCCVRLGGRPRAYCTLARRSHAASNDAHDSLRRALSTTQVTRRTLRCRSCAAVCDFLCRTALCLRASRLRQSLAASPACARRRGIFLRCTLSERLAYYHR